jgi:hypothetical protein
MVDAVVAVAFAALILIPVLFGLDSRDGRDWQPRRHR